MARTESTIGVFSDLFLGTGSSVHADFNWVGDTSSAGTPSSNTVLYREGDLVVHNSRLWVATGVSGNDNQEPAANSTYWTEIGNDDDDVLGAQAYSNTSSYVTHNLVYDTQGGLFVATQDITTQTAGSTPGGITGFTRVGGAPTNFNYPSQTFSTTAVTGGGNLNAPMLNPVTLTFSSVNEKLEFARFITGNRNFALPTATGNANPAARISIPVGSVVRFETFPQAAGAGNRKDQFRIYSVDSQPDGGQIYNGGSSTLILSNYNATVVSGATLSIVATHTHQITAGVTWTEGDHIDFTFDQATGNNITLSVKQSEIVNVDGSGPLAYNSSTGRLSLLINSTGGLSGALGGSSGGLGILRAGDDGSGITTGATGTSLKLSGQSNNGSELIAGSGTNAGLFSSEERLSVSSTSTGSTVRRLDLTKSNNAGASPVDSYADFTIGTAAGGTSGSTNPVISFGSSTTGNNGNIVINAKNIASWAEANSTGEIIPSSKLPNVQLGNTHTYESQANLLANNNALSSATGTYVTDDVQWHTGDLAVVTAADAANQGIYVFTSPTWVKTGSLTNVSLPAVSSITDATNAIVTFANPVNATTNPLLRVGQRFTVSGVTGADATTYNVQYQVMNVSTTNRNQVTTNVNTSAAAADAGAGTAERSLAAADFATVVTANTNTARVQFSNRDGSGSQVNAEAPLTSIEYNAQNDQLVFNPSNSTSNVNVDLAQHLDDNATVGGFINRIKIGENSYVFGIGPDSPTLFNNTPTGNINAYASNDFTSTIGFAANAPTSNNVFSGRTLTNTAYQLIASDPDAVTSQTTGGSGTFVTTGITRPITYSGTTTNTVNDGDGRLTLTIPATQTAIGSTYSVTARNAIRGTLETGFTIDYGATGTTGSRTLTMDAPSTTSVFTVVDGRRAPTVTSSGASLNRSVFDTSTTTFAVNSLATTANIAAGTAYDLASFTPTVNGTAATAVNFASQAGTYAYTPAAITNHNVVFSYTLAATPRNSQTGVPTANTQSISFYTPWYWTVSATAPTGVSDFTTTVARNFATGNLSVTGTVGSTIYLAIPTSVIGSRTITLRVDGSATQTDGVSIGTFTQNTAIHTAANTSTVGYTMLRFAGLSASPTLFNILAA